MSAITVSPLRRWRGGAVILVLALLLAAGGRWLLSQPDPKQTDTSSTPEGKPALTVTVTRPETREWPRVLAASGNIAAWQEVVIGPEISGYRLTEVLVDVGDRVQRGQLLARISSETVAAELAQAQAAVAESEAMLAEARADGDRARRSRGTTALSAQQADQYLAAEQTALARLASARAKVRTEEVRMTQTRVIAPDDGVISARSATLGSLAQPGEELLRLIRGGRLEWRAEIPAGEMGRLAAGGSATVIAPDGRRLPGRIRLVAPTVDPESLTGLVYVDLPVEATADPLRAGMFVRGDLELGHASALTLPGNAVIQREGFAYVLRLEPGNTVAETKVQVGRRLGDRIEIRAGLDPTASVVDSGTGFLADGDLVRVVDAPPSAPSSPMRR